MHHSTPFHVLSLTLAEVMQAKRMTSGGLSVFNGAFGVDSQDILNAPDIDFGSFQLFPDQVNYGTKGTATQVKPPNANFGKTLNETVAWIRAQADSAHAWVLPLLTADGSDLRSAFHSVGKPVVLSAFGVVTQENSPFFVPVNETSFKPFPKDQKRKL
jgi:mannan endo-1,4-beta-mannosidase